MLTQTHRAVLDLEEGRAVWRWAGAKAATIREELGMSETRYYQVLNWLLDQDEALAYAPGTVRRLGRLREGRRLARTGKGSASDG